MTNNPPHVMPVVAAMLVDAEGRLLMQQRAEGKHHAGLWEFPGGKVEPDESPEAALIRELNEELAIEVAPDAIAPTAFASVPHRRRQLLLLLYRCTSWRGTPRAVDAAAVGWFTLADLDGLPMPPADRVLVERFRERGRA
jgi:8-oxo-dGTP diphosphatase